MIGALLAGTEEGEKLVAELDKSKSGKVQELLDRLARKGQAKAVLGAMNQRRINEVNKHIETRVAEGIGERVARIDIAQFHLMRAVHGSDCWHDPDFIKAFMRDNPACRLALHTRKYVAGADLNCRASVPDAATVQTAADTAALQANEASA